ncbi:MAG: hypothetical protein ACI8RD_012324 [Bacillariaceae sp.]
MKNNAHIVLMGQAAQSRNLPSLADYVGPHPPEQNSLVGRSCQHIANSKIFFDRIRAIAPLTGQEFGVFSFTGAYLPQK